MRTRKQASSGKDLCFYPAKRHRRPAEQILVRRFLATFERSKVAYSISVIIIIESTFKNINQANSEIDNLRFEVVVPNTKRDSFGRMTLSHHRQSIPVKEESQLTVSDKA